MRRPGVPQQWIAHVFRRHGGCIAESTPHDRSRSRLMLRPPLSALRSAAADASTPAPTEERLLVLVVEDDEDTRSLYVEALSAMGYRTADEPDGARGVETAVRIRPDAILMDVSMPVLSGIDATRRLKEDPRTSGCLIILMTGHGMKKFEEARAAGCDAFFCKPFDPAALQEVLLTLASPAEQAKLHVRPEVVKECSCGRRLGLEQWLALPLCGRMHVPQRGVVIELRTCTCGSSLSVQLDDLGDVVRTAPANSPPERIRGSLAPHDSRRRPRSPCPASRAPVSRRRLRGRICRRWILRTRPRASLAPFCAHHRDPDSAA